MNQDKHDTSLQAPLLTASDISFRRRGKIILSDISLHIDRREIITLIGPNGAGKTSLVRIILGLVRPDSGNVEHAPGLRIGYVPQKVQIPDVMPMRVCDFLHLSDHCDEKICAEVMEQIACKHLMFAPMQSLSGGEMQRVLLARALLKRPQLLVLDEPVSGVDIIGQQMLYDTIRSIRDTHDCGIFMVSHDLHLVMAATDHVICLNTHVCCTGHPDDVTEHPEYLKLFGDAVEGLALYSHNHDHAHDIHGNIVAPDHSHSCEHHETERADDKGREHR